MKRLIFVLALATAALSIVFAASASEEATAETPPAKQDDPATKIMNDVTRGNANPSDGDKPKADPWSYVTELEQKSQTRLRRAEAALKLTEERLEKLLDVQKRREATVAAGAGWSNSSFSTGQTPS